MTENNIHSILFELQKNLEDLSSAKMQMEEFRSASVSVVQGFNTFQVKFVNQLTDLETDYKQRVTKLEESLSLFLLATKEENTSAIKKVVSVSEQAINEGVGDFKSVADKVDKSNIEKIESIKNLLEQYKNVVDASHSLIEKLTAIDFPTKLDVLSTKSQLIIETINNAKQSLEIKSNENHTSISEKTTAAKEQIIQNTDTKAKSLSEQLTDTKENISKSITDNYSQQAKESKLSFENLNNLIKENITQVIQRQDKQEKEIKVLKVIAIVIGVISILGIITTILLKNGIN